MGARITNYAIWTAQTIAASGSATSGAIDMRRMNSAALHLTSIAGTSPDVTFSYTVSKDADGTFVAPQAPATIGANKAANDIMDFAPETTRYIKLVATNNNGSNSVTITGKLAVQEI